MNTLVVVGNNLNSNSSANLCHKAYIQGLIDNGCTVDVLTVGNDSTELGYHSENLSLYYYPMQSLYERIGKIVKRSKKQEKTIQKENEKSTNQSTEGIFSKIKKRIRAMYGPYEVYIVWLKKAISFRSKKEYDLVLSLSFPPVSHYLVYQLLKKKHITAKRWIQIWEDPWCQDLVFKSLNTVKLIKRAQKAEEYLLKVAEEILYVSPITLEHQKEMFPAYADKMKWFPVPTYYSNLTQKNHFKGNHYGYFGDYSTQIRDLQPFYKAARKQDIEVNICGYSDKQLSSSGKITVHPRMSLEKLKPIEDNTNVLVFLSNLQGGQIPGKIYQYSATEKTILFILDGTEEEKDVLKKYFGQFNRYIFCENTVEDITRAIIEIENNCYDKMINKSLDYFEPKKIVKNILNGTEEKI